MSDPLEPIVRHQRLGHGRHALETVTLFALPIEDVFRFFCDVQNLERITPPELAFRVLTPGPVTIGRDTLIDYRLPLHPWSGVALPLVRQQLDRIFVFRGRTVRGLLGLTT
jgi:hypothetical protein